MRYGTWKLTFIIFSGSRKPPVHDEPSLGHWQITPTVVHGSGNSGCVVARPLQYGAGVYVTVRRETMVARYVYWVWGIVSMVRRFSPHVHIAIRLWNHTSECLAYCGTRACRLRAIFCTFENFKYSFFITAFFLTA